MVLISHSRQDLDNRVSSIRDVQRKFVLQEMSVSLKTEARVRSCEKGENSRVRKPAVFTHREQIDRVNVRGVHADSGQPVVSPQRSSSVQHSDVSFLL